MSPIEAEKLLGGYAAGILTKQERSALFEAAMENQALFEALADEENLRELLSDPAARQELLTSLAWTPAAPLDMPAWQIPAAAPSPVHPASERMAAGATPASTRPSGEGGRGWFDWLFRPAPLAAAGALALAAVGLFVLVPGEAPGPVEVARRNSPAPEASTERDSAVRADPLPAARPAAPASLPAPATPVKLEDRKELAELARDAAKSSEAVKNRLEPPLELASTPAPAPPQPAAAPPPLERARVEEQTQARGEERKKAGPIVAPIGGRLGAIGALSSRKQTVSPIAARLEKLGADGAYTTDSGPFESSDSVRAIVVPAFDGTLVVRFPGEPTLFAGPVRAGVRYAIPERGHLSGSGSRTLEVRLLGSAPAGAAPPAAGGGPRQDAGQYSQSPASGVRREGASSGLPPDAATVTIPVVFR